MPNSEVSFPRVSNKQKKVLVNRKNNLLSYFVIFYEKVAVDKLIINPSSRLITTPNKNRHKKAKKHWKRNFHSQTCSSDLVHISS
jgi:hypothetical protein